MLSIVSSKDQAAVEHLFARRAVRLGRAEAVVRPILNGVRKRGDQALLAYARRFDGLQGESVRVPEARLEAARGALAPQFERALDVASRQIRRFAERQMPKSWCRSFGRGVTLGQTVRPLDSVAAYIPGGRYPLPSTLMMTVIPAQTAGVKTISVASPGPSAETLGTAGRLGRRQLLPHGRCAGSRGLCIRDGNRSARRSYRGPGKYLRGGRQEIAGRCSRH